MNLEQLGQARQFVATTLERDLLAYVDSLVAQLAEAGNDLDLTRQCFEEQAEELRQCIAQLAEAELDALRELLREARAQVKWAAYQLGYSGRNEAMAVLVRIDAALERTPAEPNPLVDRLRQNAADVRAIRQKGQIVYPTDGLIECLELAAAALERKP